MTVANVKNTSEPDIFEPPMGTDVCETVNRVDCEERQVPLKHEQCKGEEGWKRVVCTRVPRKRIQTVCSEITIRTTKSVATSSHPGSETSLRHLNGASHVDNLHFLSHASAGHVSCSSNGTHDVVTDVNRQDQGGRACRTRTTWIESWRCRDTISLASNPNTRSKRPSMSRYCPTSSDRCAGVAQQSW